MKYTFIPLFFVLLTAGCNQVRQEEQAGHSDFFTTRSDNAKRIKDQNYATQPQSASTPRPQQQVEEIDAAPNDPSLEGIILETQEETPEEEMINGASETDYLEEKIQQQNDHHLNTDESFFEQEEANEEFVTPEEVRGWRN